MSTRRRSAVVGITIFVLGFIAATLMHRLGPPTPEAAPVFAAPPAATEAGLSVYFSPRGGCEAAIVAQIMAATTSIDVQAYSFTDANIAGALVDAHKRGVKVRAVLDKSNKTAQYSAATFLTNAGVSTWIDSKHAIAHNKIILIDGKTVITGSYNFTKAAEESNAENLLVVEDRPAIVAAYLANFEKHLAHATAYVSAAN